MPSPHTALSEAAEVYFNAIQKIGEQALQSSTSQILGEGLPLPLRPPCLFEPRRSSWPPSSTPGLLLPRLRGDALPAFPLPPLSGGCPAPQPRAPEGIASIISPFQEILPRQKPRPCSPGPGA